MFANTASIERLIRISVGLSLLATGLARREWWGLLGLFPLVTGVAGYCPACDLRSWIRKQP